MKNMDAPSYVNDEKTGDPIRCVRTQNCFSSFRPMLEPNQVLRDIHFKLAIAKRVFRTPWRWRQAWRLSSDL